MLEPGRRLRGHSTVSPQCGGNWIYPGPLALVMVVVVGGGGVGPQWRHEDILTAIIYWEFSRHIALLKRVKKEYKIIYGDYQTEF